MNNERIPKETVTARIEEIIQRGRPWIRWTGEFEEDLQVIRQRNWYTVVTHRNERRIVLEGKIHDGL
jgi:hypothetical protein